MAWDQWEQLKAQAAERHSTKMELNQLPGDPGQGAGGDSHQGGDLCVSQKDLAAVGNAAYQLHQGFALGAALDHVAERWVDQVQTLLDATAHISNHLDYIKGVHARDEAYIAGTLSSIPTLDAGFDQRTGQH